MPRERLPRQSIASAATPTSTVNVATSLTLDTTVLQASTLTSATGSSALTSIATSSLSTSADPTTTPSSTSTPQTTSQSTSTVPGTSSQAPTSSAPSPTTSSTPSSSPSVTPSTTTQPPIPSSSQQGTPTIITSAYTTYINGSQILTQTTIPSTIPAPSSPTSSERTAIIAGSAAGGTALLIILLSLAFFARRKRFKRLDFLQAITLKRKQERSRATLLDGEDLDDVDLARPPRGYTDYDTPWDVRERMAERRPPMWPPPNEGTRLMDPLANRDDLELSRIVDDVMGPSSTAVHFSDRSVSSVYRDSVAESEGAVHSRTVSNASNTALLDAAGLGVPSSTAPVRSSPLAQSGSVEHQARGVS